MSDLKLDLNPASPNYGDVVILNGDLVIVDGKEAVLQHILQRLRTFAEEWFLDLTVGVPYFQTIFVKGVDQNVVEALLINEILGTPGVEELQEFTAEADTPNRLLNVKFKATSLEGIIEYEGAA